MATFGAQENVDDTDYLTVDQPLPGQNFCCLSFLSPDKVLENKDKFIMKKFIESLKDKDDNISLKYSEFYTKYEDFVAIKGAEMDELFHKEGGFQTSLRVIKVRGVYNSYEEAAKRAQTLQRLDRSFHVFVGQVGYWLPWDPNADNVAEQEYLEKELNELMKNYKNNQIQRDLFYSEQIEQQKAAAAKETALKKEELKEIEEVEEVEEVEEGVEESKESSEPLSAAV